MLVASPKCSFAQYFNKLYDCDSSYEYGMDIFLRHDNNYFILAEAQQLTIGRYWLYSGVISTNGDTLISKKNIILDSTSIYLGDPGAVVQLQNENYIIPVTLVEDFGGRQRSFGGLLKLNSSGDSIFLKKYTDTSEYLDVMSAISVGKNGDYLLGGRRLRNYNSSASALLVRTDSLGDTLWTHTYKKIGTQTARINTIIPLSDGRIVIGAQSTYYRWDSSYLWSYNHDSPWFLLLDSLGNVIRDTLITNDFFLGGGAFMPISMAGTYMLAVLIPL